MSLFAPSSGGEKKYRVNVVTSIFSKWFSRCRTSLVFWNSICSFLKCKALKTPCNLQSFEACCNENLFSKQLFSEPLCMWKQLIPMFQQDLWGVSWSLNFVWMTCPYRINNSLQAHNLYFLILTCYSKMSSNFPFRFRDMTSEMMCYH